MKIMLSLFALASVLVASCDHSVDPRPLGSYRYTAYDSTGTLVVQGWLTMDLAKPDSVTGEWHFAAVGTPKNIGPQTGDGHLVGKLTDSTLWIELQPQFRDNNLGLYGIVRGDRYFGTWTWISFIGPTNAGSFVALVQ